MSNTVAASITRIDRTVTPIVASKSDETRAMRIEALSRLMQASRTPSGIIADHCKAVAANLRAEADRLDGVTA